MSTTISTNMSLPIPGVGTEPGPDWASDLNSSLTIIDAHDHTTGNGVQITPDGLNINSNLSFGSNSATSLLKTAFTSQSSALTGTNFLSFVSGNLYCNDGSGNQIAITSAGGVAGSPGSIGSLASPASATYTAGSKLFSWRADSGKAAAMDNGAITVRETNVASAKGITLQSPTSLAADYNLTLLTGLPGSTQALNITSSGALGTITYDSIGSSMTSTGANAIGSSINSATPANSIAALRTRATGTSVAAGGIAISTSSSTFTTTSATPVDVTNLTVTITTSGRPVMLMLLDEGSGSASSIGGTQANAFLAFMSYVRASTTLTLMEIGVSAQGSTNAGPGSFANYAHIDAVAAGTYTYKVQVFTVGSATLNFTRIKLAAYEL